MERMSRREAEELAAAMNASLGYEDSAAIQRASMRSSAHYSSHEEALRHSMQRNPGVAVAEPLADERTLQRMKTFSGSFFGKGNHASPKFTLAMVFTCSVVMVAEIIYNNKKEGAPFEEFSINPLFGPSTQVLLDMGAKQASKIVKDGEFYRLFTPMFLHGGILHLLFNMAFLWSFGSQLEREFGHIKVAYIYLTSGVFGVLCSAIFNPTIPSVGASGACYGLIGAAWADFILNFSFYRNQWKCVFFQLFFGTAFNVLLGMIPQLDNFAHLGGLINGFFTGLSVLTLPRYDWYAFRKPDKLYQICLKGFGIFISPIVMIIFVIILYTNDGYESFCEWCDYLSCLPTPWWSCGAVCEEGFEIDETSNPGNLTVVCPRDIGTVLLPDNGEVFGNTGEALEVALALCEKACFPDD
mmetsp:Transcript_15535/g.18842  ORF Transcript_15535/g.18842 Transcript_15535/m.18842 type:complete len:412 (+) Transcript_15535:224-1459(+)|eukprot:CAMPEP_0184022276 /NCGR_PEP_ID=MMETSP0954-20121128/10507_1 /TAXON_ID=627963 /ORGANISM="Aplanochytrium sp, Strain PBS07" /LENGTH=411 /DNA_ID=CAMNT_0026304615 /DNA_START=230 /DNA_END=1465 /DNA_ORIENTATION=-